ncbi:hypothetical protein [Moraxella bovis]|uniref:hypothetical protein n=2 Tax=Moraxella bovis TaxID=476 RepID=UPI00227BE201|nr:hypothetical protein [Moraxella bovis]WAJ72649.1 hypothetical protein LP095_07630 [Moraxella bovis]
MSLSIKEIQMAIEQAVYEITHTASYNERLWAIEEIIQSLKNVAPKANTNDKKDEQILTHKRFNRFPKAMTMSDDLGDEFWLGKDV